MRVPMIMRHGLSSDVAGLLLVRTFTYAVIGIGGGILCSRIREFLARLESTSNIDPVTQLFNQRFVTRTLRSLVLQHERYQKSFSVGLISIAGYTEAVPGPATRPALRATATHLRDSLRLIDEVGRLDDGRFVLVLPQTDKRGARIAVERVCGGVKRLLRASDQSVTIEVLSAEEDLAAIRERFGITDFEGTEAQPSRAA
jgi:diguanylate cyclase (GGDEF)-like protein